MVRAHDAESPLSDASLEGAAEEIAALWRVARRRAPKAVSRRVRLVLESVYEVVHVRAPAPAPDSPPLSTAALAERRGLCATLDALLAELRGRQVFEPQFYRDGYLAVTRAFDPIRIRGAVDHRAVEIRFERYLAHAERSFARLNYFLERAGLEREDGGEIKPWDQPYAAFEEYRELLWGRMAARQSQPPGSGLPHG